jgi:hypothetical protein
VTRLLVALLAVVVAAGAAHAQGGGPSAPRREEVDPKGRRVVSREGAFAIQMPGEPTVARQDLVAKNGHPVRYTNYAVDLGTRAYTVSYSDYDRETGIDLDSAVAGIIGDPRQVRNLDRRTITLFERPGRVVDFVKEGYRWRVRLFAVGHPLPDRRHRRPRPVRGHRAGLLHELVLAEPVADRRAQRDGAAAVRVAGAGGSVHRPIVAIAMAETIAAAMM